MPTLQLVIHKGLPQLPFGTSKCHIVAALGKPDRETAIADTPTHPASRQILEYDAYDVLVTPELGLISVSADPGTLQITINSIVINNLTPKQLAHQLTLFGSKTATVGEPDGFDDQDVRALDLGLIASYSESRITNLELHDPQWAALRQITKP